MQVTLHNKKRICQYVQLYSDGGYAWQTRSYRLIELGWDQVFCPRTHRGIALTDSMPVRSSIDVSKCGKYVVTCTASPNPDSGNILVCAHHRLDLVATSVPGVERLHPPPGPDTSPIWPLPFRASDPG